MPGVSKSLTRAGIRENRPCSLSGGRRPARKRVSSDQTPMKLSKERRAILDGGGRGKVAAQGEHTIQHRSDTEGGAVSRVERRAQNAAGKEERAVHCFAAPCDGKSHVEELRTTSGFLAHVLFVPTCPLVRRAPLILCRNQLGFLTQSGFDNNSRLSGSQIPALTIAAANRPRRSTLPTRTKKR